VGECQKGQSGEACSSKCHGLARENLLAVEALRESKNKLLMHLFLK